MVRSSAELSILSAIALRAALAASIIATISSQATAQRTFTGSSLGSVSGGFSSGTNVGFGFNLHGAGLARGDDSGPSQTIGLLPGGGFTPGGDIQFRQGGGAGAGGGFGFGFGLHGGGGDAFFRITGGQGTTRGLGSVSSSVTVLDGHSGYFGAGTLQPFVIGVIPIVGDQPNVGLLYPSTPQFTSPGRSVLEERLMRLQSETPSPASVPAPRDERAHEVPIHDGSSAAAPAQSLADIKRINSENAARKQRDLATHITAAEAAENQGDVTTASRHYRAALSLADNGKRRELAERLKKLRAPR